MSDIAEEEIARVLVEVQFPGSGEDEATVASHLPMARAVLAIVQPALERARVEERERAAGVTLRFAEAALKCDRCGDIRTTYEPGGCTGESQFRASEEFQRIQLLDSTYAAIRYFEKHLCRAREMKQEETIAAIAAAIRKG